MSKVIQKVILNEYSSIFITRVDINKSEMSYRHCNRPKALETDQFLLTTDGQTAMLGTFKLSVGYLNKFIIENQK